MQIKHRNTGICKIFGMVITMLLFIVATLLCVPQNNQDTYAVGLTNPLSGYTTMEGFSTITGEAYNSATSATNPYKIESADDLIKLAYYVNVVKDTNYATASYRMNNHISLIGYDWQPIGNETTPFSGIFDGYGYSIYGLTITTDTDVNDAGLFGYVASQVYDSVQYNPIIRLLGIKDASIESNADYVGSIAGRVIGDSTTPIAYTGIIQVTASALVQECYSVSFVKGGGVVGGLVGALTDGASIYNCYTAPSSNNVKAVDILCTSVSGSVGGIAGKVSYELNTNPAVQRTYTTCAIANNAGGSNFGGIIGDYSEISDRNLRNYRTNFYYYDNVNDYEDIGAGWELSYFASPTRYTNNGWSLTGLQDGTWTRYDRGETPSTIWKLANVVNNKFPVLTRVPQLSKITLDASLEGNNEKSQYVDYYFYGYKDISNPEDNALTAIKPIVINKHNMYIEQGQSVYLYAEYLEVRTNSLYQFDKWTLNYNTSSVVTSVGGNKFDGALDSNNRNLYVYSVGVISADCSYIVNLKYKPYGLNVSVNSSSYGSVKVKYSQTGQMGSIDWDSINESENSITPNRDAIVRIEAISTPGYKVNYWNFNGAAVIVNNNTFTGSVYEFVLDRETNIVVAFGLKEYNFTIKAEDGQGNVADLSYTIHDGDKQTTPTINNMPYGAVVKLFYDIKDGFYSFSHWSIKADGLEEYNLNITADTFSIREYNNYVVTAHFVKDRYLVNITTTNAQADISFGNGEKTQQYIAYNEVWTIKVNTIPEGYDFVKWYIYDNQNQEYNDVVEPDKDVTVREFTETGLNRNWTCEAIFVLKEYDVILSSVEYATYGDEMEAKTYAVLHGHTFEVTVKPNDGYSFKQWKDSNGNVLGLKEKLEIEIISDITIIPVIDIQQYSVFIYSESSGTSIGNDCYIQYDKDGNKSNGWYDANTEMTFEVVVPAGLAFVRYEMVTEGLTADTDYVFDSKVGTGTIKSIKQNIQIKCIFTRKDITITFGINEAGAGDYQYYAGNTEGTYLTGNELKVKAGDVLILQNPKSANQQYKFVYWLINGEPYTNKDRIIDLPLNDDTEVIGVFNKVKYELRVSQNIKGGVITVSKASPYLYGDTVTLQTTVLPGYRFDGWYDISSGQEQKLNEARTINYIVQRHTELLAKYVKQGAVYAVLSDENAGIVTGLGSFDIGKTIDLEVSVNSNYEFLYWTTGGEIIGKDTRLSMVVTNEVNIVDVVFGALQNIDVTVNNMRLGRAFGVSNAKLGEEVKLKAIPAANCGFGGWWIGDDLISTDANYTFVVNGSLTLEAKFHEQVNVTSIILIVVGCIVFVILLIVIIVYFVKQRENKKQEEYNNTPGSRHNVFEMYNVDHYDDYSSSRGTLTSIPVRKITVPPRNYRGNIKTLKYEPVDIQEYKRGRGRPKGSLNKKGRKTIAPMYPGQRGRPKGSLNKKGRKVYELRAPGKRGRPLGSKNKPKF